MRVRSLFLSLVICAAAAPALAQDSASSQAPAAGVPTVNVSSGSGAPGLEAMGIKKYLLGPGDALDLRVYNEPQFNSVLTVNDEGNVELPFIEKPILARCRTDREIKKEIVDALGKFLKKPQVSLRVTEMKSRPPATVYGAVRAPTRVQMQRRARLLELLAFSGGVTEAAGSEIQIFHTEPLLCPELEGADARPVASLTPTDPSLVPYDIYSLTDLKLGREDANPFIRPGDIVIVPEAQPVYIIGAVMSPQGIYLRDSTRMLTQAIAQVGGLRKEAKSSQVIIYRRTPGATDAEKIPVNLKDIRNSKAKDIALQPYDIVEVPDDSGSTKKMIMGMLMGSVGNIATTMGTNIPLRVLY